MDGCGRRVLRPFDSLNTTTITHLQYRISQLESKLEETYYTYDDEKNRKTSIFKGDERFNRAAQRL